MNKLHVVSSFIYDNSLHIFGVTESWLLETMPDSFVSIDGYRLFRKDTLGLHPKHGVCMYVKSRISAISIDLDCNNVLCIRLIDYDVYLPV